MKYRASKLTAVVWLASSCVLACAQGQIPPLPRGAKVKLSGSIEIDKQIGRSSSTLMAAGSRLQPNRFVLPILKPADYNQGEIVSSLNYIFENFPSAQGYATYFQLMPWQIDLEALGVHSQVLTRPPGTDVLLQPYALSGRGLGIHAIVPIGLSTLDVFKPTQPANSDSGPSKSIFITLDGFGAPVPVSVADSMEANFIDGFVTRLVLGQYQTFWKANAQDASQGGYGPLKPGFSIDVAKPNLNQQCLNQYSLTTTYPAYTIDGSGNASPLFEQDLSGQLSACPVTSIGMLYGWWVAQQLEQADAASGDPSHPLLRAVWKLLKYRFPFVRIGEMTAYTLDYLNGISQNSRIQQISQGTPASTVTDLNTIIQAAARDPNVVAAKAFLISFQDVTETEFYALTQNGNKHFKPNDRRLLVTEYYNFIVGFHQGVAKAADAHYQDAFDLGFGLGYASGFRDGYSLGFANGYADGFANGNAAAWAAANVIISSLQGQVASLQSQLAAAQSAQNGGGSGSGFWNNLGNIVSTAGSVIGTIASFF